MTSTTENVIKIYEFIHRGRVVYVQADNPDHANVVFQERFGYWPTKENQEDVHP